MECASVLQVICTKVRDGDKRIVRLKEGEPRGRHVVIVDDLVQSGGTLRECQKLLSTQVTPPKLCWKARKEKWLMSGVTMGAPVPRSSPGGTPSLLVSVSGVLLVFEGWTLSVDKPERAVKEQSHANKAVYTASKQTTGIKRIGT